MRHSLPRFVGLMGPRMLFWVGWRVDGGPLQCSRRRKGRPVSPVSGAVATEASTVGTSVEAPD